MVIVLTAGAIVAGALVAVLGQGSDRRVPIPGVVLTSAQDFSLTGSVGNLAPGLPSALTITVGNPYSVGISLSTLTVSSGASVPAGCPLTDLTINGVSFTGSSAMLTGLSEVVPAHSSLSLSSSASDGMTTSTSTAISSPTLFTTAGQYNGWLITDTAGAIPAGTTIVSETAGAGHTATLSQQATASTSGDTFTLSPAILLVRSADNGCQTVSFPFTYSATAAYTATTSTVLASAPNPSTFTQTVNFTATVSSTVSPDPGAPAPVGSVTFYKCTNPANLAAGSPASSCTTSAALSGAVAVNGSGQAVYSTSSLAVGSYAIFASFTPTDSTNFTASSSTSITQVVNKASTALALTSAPNPSNFGHSVTFTAQATPGAGPTGTVSFYLCTTNPCSSTFLLGTAALSASGKATFTTSALPPGSDYLEAVYSGDGSYLGSTSNTLTQSVTFSAPCIVISVNGGYAVSATGSICISGVGHVNGGVTVSAGGSLVVNGAVINGGITATAPAGFRICGSTINGNVTVTGATGFVVIGDGGDDGPPGCAANTITGNVTVTGGTAGFEMGGANKIIGNVTFSGNTGAGPTSEDAVPEVEGNIITGGLSCATSNSPAVVDGGQKNTVTGTRSGQCSGSGF